MKVCHGNQILNEWFNITKVPATSNDKAVSVNGVEKIFKISKAIASRLKRAAEKERLLKIKKTNSRPILKKQYNGA